MKERKKPGEVADSRPQRSPQLRNRRKSAGDVAQRSTQTRAKKVDRILRMF